MADIQIDNGNFTRIANDILEQLAKTNLNGTQRRILDVVFRMTYGYQRKEFDMSITYISKATDINKMQIQRELATLIERKIIVVISEATFSKPRVIAFNKNYDEWGQLAKKLTGNEKANSTVSEKANSTVSELANQIKKEKENNKENIYSVFDNYSSNDDLRQALRDYSIMRNKIKSPLTNRAATLLLNKLSELASTDDLKIKLLEKATLSNWKSVYPLKEDNKEPIKQATPPQKYNKFNDNMMKRPDTEFVNLEEKVRHVPDAEEIERRIKERFGS